MVVNPRQVRDFAKAAGKLAKTDVLDAHTLAHFAEVMRPEPRPLPDEQTQTLAALLTAAGNSSRCSRQRRTGSAGSASRCARACGHTFAWLERELAQTDRDLAHTIHESPVWREKDDLLRSTPGAGTRVDHHAAGESARTRHVDR